VKIALFTLAVTQVLNLILIGPLQHVGLALAIGLAACLNAGLLFWQLRRHNLFIPQPGWTGFLLRLLIAVAVMTAVLFGLMQLLPSWSEGLMWQRLLRLGGLVAAGVLAYFASLFLLGFRVRDFNRRAVL
jgi:putative peptidoglycan lipid II flippase